MLASARRARGRLEPSRVSSSLWRKMSQVPDPINLPTAFRPVRSVRKPTLSIVVVWSGTAAGLRPVLEGLVPQGARYDAEIVVTHAQHHDPADLVSMFPAVAFVELSDDSTTAERRAMGMAAVDGDIVAFAETGTPLSPEWLDQIAERGILAPPHPES